VGADGVQSHEECNNYPELGLFTDHPRKIKAVEDCLKKSKIMPWVRPDGEKTVGAPTTKMIYVCHTFM
jgi:hypothetical protein